MRTPSLYKAGAILALLWAAGSVRAEPIPVAPVCSATLNSPSWSDCAGAFLGNDKDQRFGVPVTIGAEFARSGISYLGSSNDAANGPLGNDPGGAGGTLRFDFNSPFVVSLRAGNAFSLFHFAAPAVPVSSLGFTTLGVSFDNGGGGGSGLSHAAVFAPQQVTAIPESPTYALLIAGLAALAFMARRRRQR